MKKFMSFVLTGAIALSTGVFCPAPAFSTVAEEDFETPTFGTYEHLTYYKYTDHIVIGRCDDSATEVVIPEEIEGLPVTEIGSGAFNECVNLKSVVMPDSVKLLGANAFAYCENLESITLSNSIETILFGTFVKCSNLKSISIPDSVTYIGMTAFEDCSSLTSIVIPDAVTGIGDYAFAGSKNLESITIPASVDKIGFWCFMNTKWFENKQKENPLVVINNILINGTACNGDVVIPDSVKRIDMLAFDTCSGLTSVSVPDSVTEISGGAFQNCANLKSITIENPDCEIYDYEYTICNSQGGYDFESGTTFETVFDGTIYGQPNSTAQAYAEKYGYKFETIDGQPTAETLKGDANGDNSVTIADAVAILQYLANADEYPLSEQGAKNSDVLGDDGVNTEDALQIQKLDAGVIDKL